MNSKSTSVGCFTQGLCTQCGKNKQASHCRDKYGRKKYRTICSSCRRKNRSGIPDIERDICEECGFTSKYPCQFDIHHLDCNHKNNDRSNLAVLCACCHRLKHYIHYKH